MKKPLAALTFVTAVAAAGAMGTANAEAPAPPRFLSGYAGALPSQSRDKAGDYFRKPQVRALALQLANGPVARDRAEQALAGSGASVDDLLRVKLVRAEGGDLRLAFAFFTADDIRRVHAVAARHVPSLVSAYRTDAPRLNAILARYDAASVNRKLLAFDLVAGLSLNWDALSFLDQAGYRKPVLVEGPGWHYSFWASGETPEYSYKAYYWGSTTFPAGSANFPDAPLDYSFSSFGDPDSDPRMNMPDLVTLPPDQMTPPVREAATALGFHDDDTLGFGLKNVLGLSLTRDFGSLLFALRSGPRTQAELAEAAPGVDRARLPAELRLLEAIDYVVKDGRERYALRVPVLDAQDKALVDAITAENRRILRVWMKRHYAEMRRELSDLSAVRQGVPYEALFTQIWHELFGLTTRELVAEGLLADPYGKQNPSPGSLSMLWRTSVYHFDWK